MKKMMLLVIALFCSVLLSGCGCAHEWAEATCTTAKTCSKCGETEGEALGHQWERATCIAPETCSACAETRGDMLAHVFGDWQVISETEMERSCEACGETETAPLERDIQIKAFLKGSNWIDTGSNSMYYVNFGQDGQFYMKVIDVRISGTWEYAGAQQEESSEGYHIFATNEENNQQIHFVLTNAVGDGDSYYLVCQDGAGYLIFEQFQLPDIVGTWEHGDAEWLRKIGKEAGPTLVISEDYTAVLQIETEVYSGTVEAYDDSFADMYHGGLNNKAYCISLEGHDPVYLLLGGNGRHSLYMPIEGSSTLYGTSTPLAKVG